MNNLLNKIRHDLHGLQPGDQSTLVQIGAALQQFVSELPADAIVATNLLMACLQGLQAIYQQSYREFLPLKEAINNATVVVEQLLAMPESPIAQMMAEHGQQMLAQALQDAPTAPAVTVVTGETGDSANASTDTDVAVKPQALPEIQTLDEASAFFMQLQPEERAALLHLRDALKAIVMGETLSPELKKLVIKAGKATEQLLHRKTSDPQATFDDIGRWLSEAALAQEFAGHSEPPPVISAEQPRATTTIETSAVPVVAPVSSPSTHNDTRQTTAADFGALPPDTDSSLVREFVVESCEYIEGAEAALLALENDSEDLESVNTVFRAFHTIKGTSAFLGLDNISHLAHLAESLLSRVRDREIRCTGGYADLALRSADTLKELLKSVQEALHGTPIKKPSGYDELMRLLANPEAAGISAEATTVTRSSTAAREPEPTIAPVPPPVIPPVVVEAAPVVAAVPPPPVQAVNPSDLRDSAVKATVSNGANNTAAKTANTEAARAQRANQNDRSEESFLRVRTTRLDRLIDMVGELVIAHSMIAQDETVLSNTHQDLARKAAHAGKIVRELQDLGMSMRMVPLKATFQKMARLVRDVAQKSGKVVALETEGEDTEIDRNMVDIIGDPLVHMIRNAVDHGIELPQDRLAKGKSQQGTVRLAAYHAGGYVVVELQDDGKGLDREKIVSKAIEKGLIESDKGMANSEVFNLIFAPGFSTADQVSDLSGRGVGMDVVKRNIESLRGRIHISSEAGRGSLFMMRLPLTLAITDGMLVRVGTERYIISTVNIFLSFQPTADSLSTIAGRGEMVMLRGELMPLFRLHHLFEVEGAIEDPTKGLLVVVADGKRRCALLVDELLGQQQVVAKSLGNGIGKIQGISGGAILGDGRVGLILDVPELVALVRQNGNTTDRRSIALQAAA